MQQLAYVDFEDEPERAAAKLLGKDEARRSVRAVALKPYNLRQTAAVPVASAIDHCEGILFDARGPLQRLVRKVKSKNLA